VERGTGVGGGEGGGGGVVRGRVWKREQDVGWVGRGWKGGEDKMRRGEGRRLREGRDRGEKESKCGERGRGGEFGGERYEGGVRGERVG